MTITPDDKDWTWVLKKPCDECGFDASTLDETEVAGLLRANATRWQQILGSDDTDGVRRRPEPAKWSALEYGCHVRDVCRKFAERLQLMVTEDDPLFPNWDQDATAVESRYAEQDPTIVSAELATAAETLATGFERVTGAQWQRPGRRSDGAKFTVATFARYFVHDPIHHVYDVTGQRYDAS